MLPREARVCSRVCVFEPPNVSEGNRILAVASKCTFARSPPVFYRIDFSYLKSKYYKDKRDVPMKMYFLLTLVDFDCTSCNNYQIGRRGVCLCATCTKTVILFPRYDALQYYQDEQW